MPRVPGTPQYGSSQQVADAPAQIVPQRSSVNPALLSTASTGLATFGGDLSQAGGTMARVAIDMQTRDNAQQTFAGSAAMQDKVEEYSNQALQRMGVNAQGLHEATDKWWDDTSREILDGATNPVARQALEHQLQPMRAALMGQVGRHEVRQQHTAVISSADASNNSAANAAAAHPNDPLVQQNTRDTIDRNIGVVAQLEGFTKAQVDAARETQYTRWHMGVIAAQVDTHPDAAREYYQAHIDEIAGTEHAKIEKMLEIGGIKVRTQGFAEDILSRAKNETEAIELAHAELSGEEEDATIARINSHFAQADQALQRQHRDASDAAWQAYDQGGMDAIPAATLAAMDPQQLVQMREYAHSKAKQDDSERVTDWKEFDRLMTSAVTTPAEFLKEDPNKWRYSMNTADRAKLESVRDSVLLAKGKPPYSLVTANSLTDTYVKQFGLVGEANAVNAGYVKAQYLNAFAAAQAASATPEKPLTFAELTNIGDQVTKTLVERNDEHLIAMAKPEALTVQNRIVGEFAGQITGSNSDSELTAKKNQFKAVADEVLADLRRRNGGRLDDQTVRNVMAKLSRKGQIDGSGLLSDDKGYYWEFIGRPDHTKFLPDKP